MTSLRLLADDLTGALDTAAELVGLAGPVPVFWHGAIPATLPPSAALDSGTRELDAVPAAATVSALAANLIGAGIAYKKIDSLLRGPTIAELAACMRTRDWRHCALAPAFPYQARVTRGGVQHARDAAGSWSAVGGAIVATLRAEGVDAHPGRLDAGPHPGVNVFDAETDDDLERLTLDMPPPGTLVVAGGETLRGLCLSLGARGLEVQGRIVPGLPWSIMRGGRWDGVTVVSKSGAFGHRTLLRDLIAERTS